MARRAAARTASVSWRRCDSADCFGALRHLSDAFGSGGAVALGGARALSRHGERQDPGARLDLSLATHRHQHALERLADPVGAAQARPSRCSAC